MPIGRVIETTLYGDTIRQPAPDPAAVAEPGHGDGRDARVRVHLLQEETGLSVEQSVAFTKVQRVESLFGESLRGVAGARAQVCVRACVGMTVMSMT